LHATLRILNYLTSFFSGTTAILSVFAFLFLIPFVVDPAISALTSDYDPGKKIHKKFLKAYFD